MEGLKSDPSSRFVLLHQQNPHCCHNRSYFSHENIHRYDSNLKFDWQVCQQTTVQYQGSSINDVTHLTVFYNPSHFHRRFKFANTKCPKTATTEKVLFQRSRNASNLAKKVTQTKMSNTFWKRQQNTQTPPTPHRK